MLLVARDGATFEFVSGRELGLRGLTSRLYMTRMCTWTLGVGIRRRSVVDEVASE